MLHREKNNTFTTFLLIIIYASLITALFACTRGEPFESIEETRVLMDTFATIKVYANETENGAIHKAINAAFQGMTEIEKATDSYNELSEISKINQSDSQSYTLSPILKTCIEEALRIAALSDGSLDISIEPVMRLWNFLDDNPQVPESTAIFERLSLVNYRAITLNNFQLQFAQKNMALDLGAIAKGFAVDTAIDTLKAHGIKDAMVDTGSNIRTITSELTAGKRRIWIRHPRQRSELYAYFPLDEGCVATSGDYERFFIQDSIRYHHILDPSSGYPARKCISVTVIANSALEADALSTALFVLGPEKGLRLASNMNNVEAVFVTEENNTIQWTATDGLKSKIKIVR